MHHADQNVRTEHRTGSLQLLEIFIANPFLLGSYRTKAFREAHRLLLFNHLLLDDLLQNHFFMRIFKHVRQSEHPLLLAMLEQVMQNSVFEDKPESRHSCKLLLRQTSGVSCKVLLLKLEVDFLVINRLQVEHPVVLGLVLSLREGRSQDWVALADVLDLVQGEIVVSHGGQTLRIRLCRPTREEAVRIQD